MSTAAAATDTKLKARIASARQLIRQVAAMILVHGDDRSWAKLRCFAPFASMTSSQATQVAWEFKAGAGHPPNLLLFDDWIARSFPKYWNDRVLTKPTRRMAQPSSSTPTPLPALNFEPLASPLSASDAKKVAAIVQPHIKGIHGEVQFNVESVLCRAQDSITLCGTWRIHSTTAYMYSNAVGIPKSFFDDVYGSGNISYIEMRNRDRRWGPTVFQRSTQHVIVPRTTDLVLRIWVFSPDQIPHITALWGIQQQGPLTFLVANAVNAAESAKSVQVECDFKDACAEHVAITPLRHYAADDDDDHKSPPHQPALSDLADAACTALEDERNTAELVRIKVLLAKERRRLARAKATLTRELHRERRIHAELSQQQTQTQLSA